MDINSFNNDQHLTLEELVEYNQGTLSNKEMHRLELHLIDCELCNDALEGVLKVDTPSFTGSLDNIKSKTNIEEKFEINQKQLIGIAASFILLAVVSAIFFLWPGDSHEMIAEKSPLEEKAVETIDKPTNQIIEQLDTVATDDNLQENFLATATEQEAPAVGSETRDNTAQPVIDEPIPALIAKEEITPQDTVDDISIATLATSEGELDSSDEARSKKFAAAPQAQSRQEAQGSDFNASTNDNYLPAAPKKGKRSYDRYLKRKLRYPSNAKDNNIEGEVVLKLSIDAQGNISDVVISKSLGYGCDEEAIRLVREGPSWNAGMQNGTSIVDTVSLTIPFKL